MEIWTLFAKTQVASTKNLKKVEKIWCASKKTKSAYKLIGVE